MSKNDHLVSKFIQLVIIFIQQVPENVPKVIRRTAKRRWHGSGITGGMSNTVEATTGVTYARRITGRTANAAAWAGRQNAHHAQDAYSTASAAAAAAARTIQLLAPAWVAGDLLASAQIS